MFDTHRSLDITGFDECKGLVCTLKQFFVSISGTLTKRNYTCNFRKKNLSNEFFTGVCVNNKNHHEMCQNLPATLAKNECRKKCVDENTSIQNVFCNTKGEIICRCKKT